jgi:hypothetical protein
VQMNRNATRTGKREAPIGCAWMDSYVVNPVCPEPKKRDGEEAEKKKSATSTASAFVAFSRVCVRPRQSNICIQNR